MRRLIVDKDVMVPMRDGVALATDVYRADRADPVPGVLVRLPYNKNLQTASNSQIAPDIIRLVEAGYVVVVQDCRGTHGSDGKLQPFFQEAGDGHDTVNWLSQQPFCNGIVGMAGMSYLGATQWLAAAHAPSALRAIAPAFTTDQYHEGWVFEGGAFQLGFVLLWILEGFAVPEIERRGIADAADLRQAKDAWINIRSTYESWPEVELDALKRLAPYLFEWLEHRESAKYWDEITPLRAGHSISIPALHIGGWFDIFLNGTLRAFSAMVDQTSSRASNDQHLLIGPWSHGNFTGAFSQVDYGVLASTAGIDLTGIQIRWFDRWLKGYAPTEEEPPVRFFVMGSNRWDSSDRWPPRSDELSLFLDGPADADGLGSLSLQPAVNETPDEYSYDPGNPVPTLGGNTILPGGLVARNAGPADQQPILGRQDVLVYTSQPLLSDIEIVGSIQLDLFASSSTPDTDFVARLIDVHPDGRCLAVADGHLRARYRNTPFQPRQLRPDEIYRLQIDLNATALEFQAGHRIGLLVTSSDFPRFERNPNTATSQTFEAVANWRIARNRVHHDLTHPSCLRLPVIQGEFRT